MKIDLQAFLLKSFGTIGICWYYLCLIVIGFKLSNDASVEQFRQFMSLSITTISVALATFVGMLLGFRGVSETIQQGIEQVPQAQREGTSALALVAQVAQGTSMQWWASGAYALSIAIAIFCWWTMGDQSDPAIVNLAKSLLGLAAGALSVLLNVPRKA